jgi:hypothetical protein
VAGRHHPRMSFAGSTATVAGALDALARYLT